MLRNVVQSFLIVGGLLTTAIYAGAGPLGGDQVPPAAIGATLFRDIARAAESRRRLDHGRDRAGGHGTSEEQEIFRLFGVLPPEPAASVSSVSSAQGL